MRSHLEFDANTTAAVLDAPATDVPVNADASAFIKDGIAAAQKGDRESARNLLTRAAGLDPRCEDAWMWLASISEYPEELLAFLNNVLDINPQNQRAIEWHAATRSLLGRTFVQRGVDAHNEGSPALADSFFDQALGHDDRLAVAWLWKARLAASDEQKVAYLERALEIDPDNAEANEAIAPFRGPTAEEQFEKAKWAAVAGRRSEAMQLLDEVLEKTPANAEAWILRSHFSLHLNDKVSALEKALEIEPENYAARAGYDFLKATVNGAQPPIQTADSTEQPLVVTEFVDESDEYFSDVVEVEDEVVEPALPFDEVPEEAAVLIAEAEPATEDVCLEAEPDALPPATAGYEVAPEMSDGKTAADPFAEMASLEPVQDEASGFEATVFTYGVPETEPQTNFEEVLEAAPYYVGMQTANGADTAQFVQLGDDHDIDSSGDSETYPEADGVVPEFAGETSVDDHEETHSVSEEPDSACVFCHARVHSQAFECGNCCAVLTLSDIESLLANTRADHTTIQQAVTRMEAEWNSREFSVNELTALSIGHFNLHHFDQGFKYLQEAARLDPNNVILAGQVNALAIRLDEIRRQGEIDGSKPKGKSILVVDDSPTVRKLISAKLEKSGHTVTCAADGVEGLARLENGLPDLVLLDIAMPRMDGYEVCRQIRSNPALAAVPVVMISGKDGFFDKVRGRMAGCTGYVTKPFGPETLMKALETYLLPDNGLAG